MVIDVGTQLGLVARSVTELERDGKPHRSVTLERTYNTTVDDLWDAVTSAERIPRWLGNISGDLKLGGRFQLEGNASGTITECVPPNRLSLTWEFGSTLSWVEVRIAPHGQTRARLTLSHICPVDDHWRTYGPGATGVGWELGLLGLAMHLDDLNAERPDEMAFVTSPEGKGYIIGASERWGQAAVAAGENPADAEAAAKHNAAFYTGEQTPASPAC